MKSSGDADRVSGDGRTAGALPASLAQAGTEQLLTQQVAERTRELLALLDVSRNVASTLELQPLLGLILDHLKLVADYTGAAIGTVEGSTFTVLDSRGPGGREEEAIGRSISLPPGNPIADSIMRQEPVIIADVRADDPLAHASQELAGGRPGAPVRTYIRSWLLVPLVLKDSVVGLLTLSRDQPNFYTPHHAQLAVAFASQTAVAIDNARLFQESREAARRTAALAQIASSVALAGSLQSVLNELAKNVVQTVGAAAAAVVLLEGDPPLEHIAGWHGGDEGWVAAYDAAIQSGARSISRRTLRERRPVVLRNAHQVNLSLPEWEPIHRLMEDVTWDIYVSLPLTARDRDLGTLAICYEPGNELGDDELAFLSAVAGQAAIAVENARLFAQTEQRMRELEALYRADERLYGSLQTSEVLEALVDVAMDILEADKSTVMVWDDQHEHLVVGAARGFRPETVARMIHAPGEGITSLVAETGQPVAVADASTDPRVAHRITDGEGIRSLIHVPVVVDNQVFAVFGVNYCRPHPVGEYERRVLQALAQRAALAIENARLYSQAQRAAALEERQRLARELHDSVSQALYGIALGARTARTMLDRDPAGAVAPTDYVLSLAEAGLAEMRALIFELRPESLEREGLVAALDRQATLLRSRHGIGVQMDLCEEPEMTLDCKEAFYRVAQEAMHNTVKPARATEVDLRLAVDGDEIVLEVRDNGSGFDPHGSFPGHLGLRSMSERVARLRGALEIESGPDRGTCVRARLRGNAAAGQTGTGAMAGQRGRARGRRLLQSSEKL